MKTRIATAAVLAAACVTSSEAYLLDTSAGVFPAGVRAENANGVIPDVKGYKRGYTAEGWTVDRTGDRGDVALCPTYSGYPEDGKALQSDNILTLPPLDIKEGDVLRWDTKSMHPDLPEAYSVEIQIEGAEEKENVYTDGEVSSEWHTSIVSLSEYAGKKIEISFRCTSANKYMLALDRVFVGMPDETDLRVTSLPPVFHAGKQEGATPVSISIGNFGKPLPNGKIRLECSSETADIKEIPTIDTGASLQVDLAALLEYNSTTPYSVYYVPDDGTDEIRLAEGIMFKSDFVRNLFVDKATGMWCNNCPDGTLALQDLQKKYGGNVIAVEAHSNDALANDTYITALGCRSLPTLELNRIRESSDDGCSRFGDYIFEPVDFGINIAGVEFDSKGNATVYAKVHSSAAIDNSSDRYRVGYVVIADFYNPLSAYYQSNNCNRPDRGQFYFLPSRIPAPLVRFHNVALTTECAFEGIAHSLPAEITPGMSHSLSFGITCPEKLDDLHEAKIAAYILDTETGKIANAVSGALNADYSGIQETATEGHMLSESSISISSNGGITLHLGENESYTLTVTDASGHILREYDGKHHAGDVTATGLPSGIYLITLQTSAGKVTKKSLLTV